MTKTIIEVLAKLDGIRLYEGCPHWVDPTGKGHTEPSGVYLVNTTMTMIIQPCSNHLRNFFTENDVICDWWSVYG